MFPPRTIMKITDSKYIGITGDGTKTLKKVMRKAAIKPKQRMGKHQYNEFHSGNRFTELNDNFPTKRSRFAYRRPFYKSSRKSDQNFKIQELPRITEVSEVNWSFLQMKKKLIGPIRLYISNLPYIIYPDHPRDRRFKKLSHFIK